MKQKSASNGLDRLFESLGDCLTPETAQRLIRLKADAKLQARIDSLAKKCNQGTLSQAERAEYEGYVYLGTFISLLKSKARQLLSQANPVS